MKIVDDEGTELAHDGTTFGRLLVRGPWTAKRYFRDQQDCVDSDGWFDTGDVATIDEYGYMQITDRSKDLIKSGGEWINPTEIETVISALPCVSQSAVIGRSDPKWGERPLLLVELRDGYSPTDAELLAELDGRVASWWIPDHVVRLTQMPLAPTGKIDKLRLRNEYCNA